LPKYDILEEGLDDAEALEQWVFFFRAAETHNAEELRRLLPDTAYQKATEVLEMISHSPDLRLIYDDRAKEAKDKFSFAKDARAEGLAEGEAKGRVEGESKGKLIGRIQILEQLLTLPETAEATLSGMKEARLTSLASDLQQRLQNRSR